MRAEIFSCNVRIALEGATVLYSPRIAGSVNCAVVSLHLVIANNVEITALFSSRATTTTCGNDCKEIEMSPSGKHDDLGIGVWDDI